MKNITTIVFALFFSFNFATAQDTLYVYKSEAVIYKRDVISIDSITFAKPATIADSVMYIYKSGKIVYEKRVSSIDSITFIKPVANTNSFIFDIKSIPEITVEISTTEWNNFLSFFDQNNDNEEYISSNFSFTKNGKEIELENVGFRLKGNTSRRRPEGIEGEPHNATDPQWHHASFTLNFKKYIKGQELAGAEKISLKWFKDDPTYVRELYCYDLFERFGVWTAPQSSYCRLNIKIKEDAKTAYYGIYQMIESFDEEFLKRRLGKFADDKGNLWKGSWGADLKNADTTRMDIENVTLTSTYTPVYDLKTNNSKLTAAKIQLADFITKLNSFSLKTTQSKTDFKTWISSKMDVQLFLKTYAVNVMCGMWDDYWQNQNNYYFYFDSAGKFYFIPYDYDNTLGTSLMINDSGTQDVLNWGSSSRPLVKKIITIDEYKTLYVGYIRELCNSNNNYFHVDKSIARINNWQSMIKKYVNNDTGEDTQILDEPASWGNCSFYRLLDSENNYFIIRAANIP